MTRLGVWDEFTGGFIEVDSEKLLKALKNMEFVKVKKPDYSWIRELDVYSPEEREAWIRYFEDIDVVGNMGDSKVSDLTGSKEDVNPSHYDFPGGVQVIDITKHLDFLSGNVIKYVSRAGRKGDRLTDLLKAEKYLRWAIEKERDENSNRNLAH